MILCSEHVIFALGAYGEELRRVPQGATVAVFGMTMNMEDVLLRGGYLGIHRIAGVPCGVVRADWVYNAMPPVPGQIYPPLPLEPVEVF